MMKTKFTLLVFLILATLIACSPEPDCFVADSVTQVKVIKADKQSYYVYLRVSGFQEKEAFFELFVKQPEFDVCGKSNIDSISDLHIDQERGTVSKIQIKNNKLDVVYTKNNKQPVDLKNSPVELVRTGG